MSESPTPEYVALTNTTGEEQYTIFNGQRHSIQAFSTDIFTADVANSFLITHGGRVVEAKGTGSASVQVERPTEMWLYNTTGNPDAPEQITLPRGGTVDNPFIKPRIVREVANRGQELGMGPAEMTLLAKGQQTYEIYPWTRKAFPAHMARWLLGRSGSHDVPGILRESRPPSSFEPNSTWELDDIQFYLLVCDGSVRNVGSSTEQLRKLHASSSSRSTEILNEEFGVGTYKMLDFDTLYALAKEKAMRRVFFRLADPRYKLPTKPEFDAYKAKVLSERESAAESQKGKKDKSQGASASA